MRYLLVAFFSFCLSVPTFATPREVHIPLKACHIDIHRVTDSHFIEGLNESLGDGCRVTVDGDALLLHFDREKLPADWNAAKMAMRVFTACAAPENTAAQQRRFGLFFSPKLDETKPMVILIHGLDCDHGVWKSLAPRLEESGQQVAYFDYPAAQGLDDSAKLLAKNIAALHETYPKLHINLMTHSMGALVARAYVEGIEYGGGVDRLLLLTPPNHGSSWTCAEPMLKAQENFQRWRHDPEWHWTWMVTEGLGEAARDLTPGSHFLKELNDRPRRAGVRYTIIAGSQNPGWRYASTAVAATAKCLPNRVTNWWGFRQYSAVVNRGATVLANHVSNNDGPVSIESAKLDGVSDMVILQADHSTLYESHEGKPPVAWVTILDRLSK